MKWRRHCRKKDCRHQTKATRVSTLVQGSSRDAEPKRTHRAGLWTLCRPLPAPKSIHHRIPPPAASTICCCMLLLMLLLCPACTPRRKPQAPSCCQCCDGSHTQQSLAAALLQAPCRFQLLCTGAPRPRRMASRLSLSISPTADRLIRPHVQPEHPFQWPAVHHGMRYTQNDPTTQLDRSCTQLHRQASRNRHRGPGASLCPCAEITTLGPVYWLLGIVVSVLPTTVRLEATDGATRTCTLHATTQVWPASGETLYRNH